MSNKKTDLATVSDIEAPKEPRQELTKAQIMEIMNIFATVKMKHSGKSVVAMLDKDGEQETFVFNKEDEDKPKN